MKPGKIGIFKILIFLLSTAIILHPNLANSADVNKSLFTGTKKQLLEKYSTMLNSKNNTFAQRTLLLTLINILNSKNTFPEIKKFKVKNQYDFLLLLKRIAQLKLLKTKISKKIGEIEEKLSLLKNNIEQIKGNSSKLIIYQLQYAMYELTKNKLLKEQDYISSHFNDWLNTLYRRFLTVKFKPILFEANTKGLSKKYKLIDNYIQQIRVEMDRDEILNDTKALAKNESKLKWYESEQDNILEKIIDYSILKSLSKIKKNKAVDLSKTINLTKKIKNRKLTLLENEEIKLVIYIEKQKLGSLKVLTKQLKVSVYNILSSIWSFVNKPLFTIGSSGVSIMSIILALVIFIAGVKAGKIYKTKIRTTKLPKNFTESTRVVISNVGFYVIIAITFFISLKVVGINLSSLTVILGALSVGVGFGLQNIVSNFIAGIILMLENSIRIGDYIEISNDLRGIVKDIHIRSTTILTNDHIEVVVPNQTLFQNSVINWTLSERVKRFRIPFSVAYGTKIEKVEEAVLGALEKSDLNYIKDNPSKKPMVVFISMNNSSIDFNLDVWVSGIDLIYPRRTTSKFLKLIYNALYEHGIEIPFPQMDIHFKNELKVKTGDKN